MVEILLRVKDRLDDNPTKEIEVRRMDRGTVIVWMPDGWTWSDNELTHDFWRIIRFSSMTVSEAEALVAPEFDPAGLKVNRWARIRKFDLDSLSITGKFRAFLDDDTRTTPIFKFTGDLGLIDAITITRPPADSVMSL